MSTEKQEPRGYFTINDYDMLEQITGTEGTPLYETPLPCQSCQAKREWVGLTDGDIAQTMHGSVEGSNMLPYQFARAIEVKLKDKNGC